jgi:hypothetical protein
MALPTLDSFVVQKTHFFFVVNNDIYSKIDFFLYSRRHYPSIAMIFATKSKNALTNHFFN